LPASSHLQVVTIPGIGEATAAVLVAKIVDIDRFATPNQLVNYFGAFPEENSSGVDKYGKPLPPGTLHMSRKGNDPVRSYLWNAARTAIRHNPAVRALHRRLRAKGQRGDVAMGHCMRKLLHLVFAVWKTDRPFDEAHFAWGAPTGISAAAMSPPSSCAGALAGDEEAVGHTRAVPAEEVVATDLPTVEPPPPPVKATRPLTTAPRPEVDFAFLRHQVTMKQVLEHLGLLSRLHGNGPQRRGPGPVHSHPADQGRTFSVHLGKNAFQCFQADCGVKGNALDLWAAIHRLPLYDAALHLAETFQVPRNREEEPVGGTRHSGGEATSSRSASTESCDIN
jgi:Transposase IS116/IS110/IS902 family